MMSSTCFEPVLYCLILLNVNKIYHTYMYNRLPEDELCGSKHVEDIVKIKICLTNMHFIGIIRLYYNAHCKEYKQVSDRLN
jgi:hypothetical protein